MAIHSCALVPPHQALVSEPAGIVLDSDPMPLLHGSAAGAHSNRAVVRRKYPVRYLNRFAFVLILGSMCEIDR